MLVVVPGMSFARIEARLSALGWAGGPTVRLAPVVAGEPELALWRHGPSTITYEFNPVCRLRLVKLSGTPEQREAVARALVTVARTEIDRWLSSEDEETALRGVLADRALRQAPIPR